MNVKSQDLIHLKKNNSIKINVPEPSDVCVIAGSNSYLVVSDHGILYKVDENGKVLQTAAVTGADFEGVCIWNNKIYVSEESFRKIMVYDLTTLDFEYAVPVNYSGGRNEGFESITRNEAKNCFVLISEKNPSLIIEADDNFNFLKEYSTPVNEVSSATFYKNKLYLLSDEAHKVYELDPYNYSIKKRWDIPVTNPEGISFNEAGDLFIMSDDRAMMFSFKPFNP